MGASRVIGMTVFCPHCHQSMPDVDRQAMRDQREAIGLIRKQLAHRIGVAIHTLTSWELGIRHPSAEHYKAWRAALGME